MASATGVEAARDSEARLVGALLDVAFGDPAEESEAFSHVARHAAQMVGAEAGGVLRFLGDERAVVIGVWRQESSQRMPVNAELDFNRRNSALGLARSTRRPARVDSYEGGRGELPLVMEAIGLRASVVAPILRDGEAWGGVVASTSRPEPLPPESEQQLAAVAELVAQALGGRDARLELAQSRVRIVAAADEARRRLERALHDAPRQDLLALQLQLRVARSMAGEASELATLLEDAAAAAKQADESLRELARRIYPLALSERGLAAAVQALAVRQPFPVSMRQLPGRRFDQLVEATAYFTVRDALERVAERPGAGEASVLVLDESDKLVVEVVDDSPDAGGAGLEMAADRVAALGGRFEVDGGRVRAVIPVER